MKITASLTVIVGLLLISGWTGVQVSALGDVDPHAYYNALLARPDYWKSYSLRDAAQLEMYKLARTREAWVTYDPDHDPYPKRQDAAKVLIPQFNPVVIDGLAQAVALSDTSIVLNSALATEMLHQRALKIDGEVMLVQRSGSIVNKTVTVLRGQWGTAPATHAAGTVVHGSVNSLLNQVRFPVGTQDGYRYLFTWDAWWGKEFLFSNAGLLNYKTWQFTSPATFTSIKDSQWLQVNTKFGLAPTPEDIGKVDIHGYDWPDRPLGPGITNDEPIQPMAGEFTVRPEKWTRYWLLVDQRANDWDRVTLWVADEDRDPVKLIDALPFSVINDIRQFWLEYNTSTDKLVPNRAPLVSYVRNWVALRDVANVAPLLVRPGKGVPLPPLSGVPNAPTNLRIIK